MTFDFSAIDTGTPQQADTWAFDHIKDALPADAPMWQVHQAYAAELCERLDGYKMTAPLLRKWFDATAALREIATADPLIYLDIVHHFADALERCTSESVGMSH